LLFSQFSSLTLKQPETKVRTTATKMNASISSNLPSHNRHSIKRVVGMFTTKKVAISQHGDGEKTPPQVDSSSPEKDRNNIGAAMRNEKIENARSIANAVRQLFTTKTLAISQNGDVEKTPPPQVDSNSPKKDRNNIGAAMRTEKIENARSIANAVRQQRQKKTAISATTIMQNALLERLEAKLLANETECTKLRKLAEVGRRGIPMSMASLQLGFELAKESYLGDSYLLKKIEAFVLEKENECTEVHRLLVVARKKRERSMARSVSVPTHPGPPKSILRRQPYSRSLKSVSWR
jgi:hypothetical protein